MSGIQNKIYKIKWTHFKRPKFWFIAPTDRTVALGIDFRIHRIPNSRMKKDKKKYVLYNKSQFVGVFRKLNSAKKVADLITNG